MADIENFNLNLLQLERGTRFFDATDKWHQPFERSKSTFIDEDGNEWYRYDKAVRVWTVVEYEYLGRLSDFFTPEPDTPEKMIEDFVDLYDSDVYVRNVETGKVFEIYAHRDCASLDEQCITEAIEEAGNDHS